MLAERALRPRGREGAAGTREGRARVQGIPEGLRMREGKRLGRQRVGERQAWREKGSGREKGC